LVWNAIASITPMIWPIWLDDISISPMAETALSTTSLDRAASDFALATIALTRWAPSEVFFTLAVISSSDAAVSSKLAACCSVRRASAPAPCAISTMLDLMAAVMPETAATIWFNDATVALRLVRRPSKSAEKAPSSRPVKSPEASAFKPAESVETDPRDNPRRLRKIIRFKARGRHRTARGHGKLFRRPRLTDGAASVFQ
jgi:hypothetical protein